MDKIGHYARADFDQLLDSILLACLNNLIIWMF